MNIVILRISIIIIFSGFCSTGYCSEIYGKIMDGEKNELLVGATIYIKELKNSTDSGLDGSYHIKFKVPNSKFKVTIVCSFIGYISQEETVSINDNSSSIHLNFILKSASVNINEVNIVATKISAQKIVQGKLKEIARI